KITSRTRNDLCIIIPRNANQIRLTRLLTPTISRTCATVRIDPSKRFTKRESALTRSRINKSDPHIFAPELSHNSVSIDVIRRVVHRICKNDTTVETSKRLECVRIRECEILETINNTRMILDER